MWEGVVQVITPLTVFYVTFISDWTLYELYL